MTDDLNAALLRLMDLGSPSLHCHDDKTWSCTLALHSATKGSDFKMRSGYNHKSPLDAVGELTKRLKEM